jgi:hypothetical protein
MSMVGGGIDDFISIAETGDVSHTLSFSVCFLGLNVSRLTPDGDDTWLL